MKTFLEVMLPEKQEKPVQASVGVLSHSESGHAVPFSPQDFCSPCEFVFHTHNTTDTTGQSPHQSKIIFIVEVLKLAIAQ